MKVSATVQVIVRIEQPPGQEAIDLPQEELMVVFQHGPEGRFGTHCRTVVRDSRLAQRAACSAGEPSA